MNKNTNGENASQGSATQTIDSAESLNHRDIRINESVQFEIPTPLIAWLARINQRFLSENVLENLLE